MPINDYALMLREGLLALNSTEVGDWVKVGQTPFHNMVTRVHLPSDGGGVNTVSINIQQADDDSGTNAETVPAGSPTAAIGVGEKTYQWPLRLTRPYARYRVTAVAGAWGKAQIMFALADQAITP